MARITMHKSLPAAHKALLTLDNYLKTIDLPPRLIELIRIRASQMNGCAYCLSMHSKSAQALGERVERLLALSAWRESPLFSSDERAALALTEEVTQIASHGVSDAVYAGLDAHFSDVQKAQLIMLIATINAWNRVAVSTQVH